MGCLVTKENVSIFCCLRFSGKHQQRKININKGFLFFCHFSLPSLLACKAAEDVVSDRHQLGSPDLNPILLYSVGKGPEQI